MSETNERPKRHAPKKLDPDFIVESASFSPREKSRLVSPPRKRPCLSLSKSHSLSGNPESSIDKLFTGDTPLEINVQANESKSPHVTRPRKVRRPKSKGSVKKTKLQDNQNANGTLKSDMLHLSEVTESGGIKADSSVCVEDEMENQKISADANLPGQMLEMRTEKISTLNVGTENLSTTQKLNGTPKAISLCKPANITPVNRMMKSSPSASKKIGVYKKCQRSTCPTERPICFVGRGACAGAGYTSRWHHLSAGEHFCNSCFENVYRSHREGYRAFAKWKRIWSVNGRSEANITNYMVDQILPYWLCCCKCKKWRQVSRDLRINPEFVARYHCGVNVDGTEKNGAQECETAEDERVSAVKDVTWLSTLMYPCFLQQSLAAPFMRKYHQDSVGLSPFFNTREQVVDGFLEKQNSVALNSDSQSDTSESEEIEVNKMTNRSVSIGKLPELQVNLPSWSQPFMDCVDDAETAMCFCPSIMTQDEVYTFPQYARQQTIYLALRNLVVTLWNMDCKVAVSVARCHQYLFCHGMVRILCVQELSPVISYLSLHGYINTGFFSVMPKELHIRGAENLHVLVVGGGPAGLSTARHLQNHGVKVTVLEAKNCAGGRCHDNDSLGLCIGEGAQIINGSMNNPLSILCHQLSSPLKDIKDRCDLYQKNGQVTLPFLDRRIDFHFNAMLDNVAEWRKDKHQVKQDTDLMTKIKDMHQQFLEESQLKFSTEEQKLLHFQCANLEYACGCSLDRVSAIHWDQNEIYPQFAGPHCFVTEGLGTLFMDLAGGLDVRFNSQVTKIDYLTDEVTVKTVDGASFHGDRVVVTVPLAVLQRNVVEFSPPLPSKKVKALQKLGAGQVEKVALQFAQPFWGKKIEGSDFFGHVPECEEEQGHFGVFYYIQPKVLREGPYILLTYLSGKAVEQMKNKSDSLIVDECVQTLRKLFPEETVPSPVKYFVSHWKDDPNISMAYTHIPVGCTGNAFDDLAEMVDEKLHFAGEATNRQFPQSVTGAYLSGIREAYLILTGLNLPHKDEPKVLVRPGIRGRKPRTKFQPKISSDSSDSSKETEIKVEDMIKDETPKLNIEENVV